jgi:hypothetical protein
LALARSCRPRHPSDRPPGGRDHHRRPDLRRRLLAAGPAFGDVQTQGEAANWVSNLSGWVGVIYGLFVMGYYILFQMKNPALPGWRRSTWTTRM